MNTASALSAVPAVVVARLPLLVAAGGDNGVVDTRSVAMEDADIDEESDNDDIDEKFEDNRTCCPPKNGRGNIDNESPFSSSTTS